MVNDDHSRETAAESIGRQMEIAATVLQFGTFWFRGLRSAHS